MLRGRRVVLVLVLVETERERELQEVLSFVGVVVVSSGCL